MADLDALDQEYREKKIKEKIATFDFMKFVYDYDKKSFARYLYREDAFTCSYFKEGKCKASSVANNHPSKEKCEHQSNVDTLIVAIQKLFESKLDDAKRIYNLLVDDDYLYDSNCRQYNGGPLSVLFSDPSYIKGIRWNLEKITGESEIFSIEFMVKRYYSK